MSAFFHVFRRRTRIHGVLECVTGLRIGRGRTSDAHTTDLPILRDARGVPVIPGSSIKGVVRSQIEAVFRSIDVRWAGDPFEQAEAPSDDKGTAKDRAKQHRDWIERHADQAGRIFGFAGLASHVRFSDAYPLEGALPTVEVRDGVGIDRDLGRVSGTHKYDFEVVSAGSRFGFELMMDGLEDAQEGAVVAGLELLHEGFARLGGFKSRGLGLVRFTDLEVDGIAGPSLERFRHEWTSYRARSLEAFHGWIAEHSGRSA